MMRIVGDYHHRGIGTFLKNIRELSCLDRRGVRWQEVGEVILDDRSQGREKRERRKETSNPHNDDGVSEANGEQTKLFKKTTQCSLPSIRVALPASTTSAKKWIFLVVKTTCSQSFIKHLNQLGR